jgi:hypothetical protein
LTVTIVTGVNLAVDGDREAHEHRHHGDEDDAGKQQPPVLRAGVVGDVHVHEVTP